jgi:hypothetical protein
MIIYSNLSFSETQFNTHCKEKYYVLITLQIYYTITKIPRHKYG